MAAASARGRRQTVPCGRCLPGEVPDEGAHHEDVRVREVDEAQDAVDHRVAERDQGVDGPQGEAVQELLEELRHRSQGRGALYGAMLWTNLNLPSFTMITTAAFEALRSLSIVVTPVTPW